MTDQQVQFVERARTGDGGYSEALVEIEDEWYPIQVIGNDAEMAVVEGK
ncbi:hypothetical protein [Halospeciosus flavus]|uniref:Uncharacterized protein n=1 Tax=Halospeciosus flavus TaxID=3032283 RepID=A0ABD5Z3H5_9EURY|nr:hypothetical protein [Halospeciosus flavus]